jgi:hypothetical protein
MSNRQQMLGQRVELRQRLLRSRAECEALRERLNRLLGTPADAVEILVRNDILDTAAALHTSLGELEELNRMVGVLNRELGD